jgi:hypothetical protein
VRMLRFMCAGLPFPKNFGVQLLVHRLGTSPTFFCDE